MNPQKQPIITEGRTMPPRTRPAEREATTTASSGYCEQHKGEGWKSYKPVNHANSADTEQSGKSSGADTKA